MRLLPGERRGVSPPWNGCCGVLLLISAGCGVLEPSTGSERDGMIYLRGGTYYEKVSLSRSGTAKEPSISLTASRPELPSAS